MTPALIGKKLGMTHVYSDGGKAEPVTVIQAGPCTIMQVKTPEVDGYHAVQLSFGDVKPHRSTKPLIGHAAKAGTGPKQKIKELRLDDPTDAQPGDIVTVEIFDEQQVRKVDVISFSKGHGFTGVMKRHHFGGQIASHGVERKHRSAGSISAYSSDLGHGGNLKKGKPMAGRSGHVRCTVKNQKLIRVDKENNLLLVRGGVPGPNGSLVYIRRSQSDMGDKK